MTAESDHPFIGESNLLAVRASDTSVIVDGEESAVLIRIQRTRLREYLLATHSVAPLRNKSFRKRTRLLRAVAVAEAHDTLPEWAKTAMSMDPLVVAAHYDIQPRS